MLDISNHTEPNFTEFVFPIFLMAFNSGTYNNIQVINDTVVKETICDALNFFTTVKNNVSIAAQNSKSPDNPSYQGNIVLNFLIFSCSIFSKLFSISKFYPHLFLIS